MKLENVTPGALGNRVYRLVFIDGEDDAARAQFEVFMEALAKYSERNVHYRDNWKRMGWRGMLVRVRERAERLWDALWNAAADSHAMAGGSTEHEQRLDDAIDLINFGGFLVRAVRENNRDGTWWDDIDDV